ncbi:MAG: Tm-1-like ATP-binding domain-containing protein, partial [Vicinamibacteraceae bacterium]
MSTIAVVGTLDTKGVEHAFVADCIRELGHDVLMVDVGGQGPA